MNGWIRREMELEDVDVDVEEEAWTLRATYIAKKSKNPGKRKKKSHHPRYLSILESQDGKCGTFISIMYVCTTVRGTWMNLDSNHACSVVLCGRDRGDQASRMVLEICLVEIITTELVLN